MNRIFLIVTLFIGFQIPALAQMSGGFQKTDFGESVSVGGSFYHKVQLVAVVNGVALLKTQEGDIKIPWSSLPVDFQKKHAGEIDGLNKAAQETAKGVKTFNGRILQSVQGGVLLKNQNTLFIQGLSGYPDNAFILIKAYPDGLYSYTNVMGAKATVEKWVLVEVIQRFE